MSFNNMPLLALAVYFAAFPLTSPNTGNNHIFPGCPQYSRFICILEHLWENCATDAELKMHGMTPKTLEHIPHAKALQHMHLQVLQHAHPNPQSAFGQVGHSQELRILTNDMILLETSMLAEPSVVCQSRVRTLLFSHLSLKFMTRRLKLQQLRLSLAFPCHSTMSVSFSWHSLFTTGNNYMRT